MVSTVHFSSQTWIPTDTALTDKANMPTSAPRAVFGVTLEESLDVAQFGGLPAVIFRCIEFLEAKHAELEEGVYRLSGSSAVIKSLKDRFNAGALKRS